MPTNATKLAAHLRRVRNRTGLTQHAFARKLGISQQKLSDWENGKRLRPLIGAIRLRQLLGRL